MTTRALPPRPVEEAAPAASFASLVAALRRPETYPHPAGDLRWHETHLSWVALAGQYAYKLKKPVDFGFLDFTTRERRAAACADEVRLNRRLCPEIYLGVAHLVEEAGRWVVRWPDEEGRHVPGEPLVLMRRLPESGLLPRLLAAGTADRRLITRIAHRLASFHATVPTGPGVDEFGDPAAVQRNWAENFEQTRPFVGRTIAPEVDDDIRSSVQRFLLEQTPLLAERVAAGRIRDCHGDLHAGNIAIASRRLYLFDCLEFSRRFRCGDVAAEVAFLAMDLDHHGHADLAAAFVESYMRVSGDAELGRLLRFYTCYRAYVRGKVLSFRLDEPGLTPAAAAEVTAEAQAYFDLAWSYTRTHSAPLLIVTMGPPASGKTALAHALASHFGFIHLSSDVLRKELAGLTPTSRRDDAFGTGLYTPALKRRTYGALRHRASLWLWRGRSVIVDATFGAAPDRRWLASLAAHTGSRLLVFACTADDATLEARLAARRTDPHATSDARPEIWPALRAAYHPPGELHGVETIDTTAPLGEVVARALTVVRQAMGAVAELSTDGPAAAD